MEWTNATHPVFSLYDNLVGDCCGSISTNCRTSRHIQEQYKHQGLIISSQVVVSHCLAYYIHNKSDHSPSVHNMIQYK